MKLALRSVGVVAGFPFIMLAYLTGFLGSVLIEAAETLIDCGDDIIDATWGEDE